ncbi:prevent-host-death protein [bacterium]|nr:prevent-host-death protein [bacterium]
MKALTQNDVINNILKILEMVKSGEEIIIKNEENQENVAVIISYEKYKNNQERPLGILKGKATYKIRDDFKITDEELLTL